MTQRIISCLVLALTLWPDSASAYDAFSDERAPAHFILQGEDDMRLVLKGQWELAWRNLEGAGGVGRDSASDTVTLGTRSAHVGVDGLRLAMRLETGEDLAFYSAFLFDDRGARAEGAWLDHRRAFGGLLLHSEAGLHTPFVAVDDGTSRPPLSARIYWGEPEVHVTSTLARGGGSLRWWLGGSLAMMRPLWAQQVNDASSAGGTITVLSYGPAETFSGNQPVVGGRMGLGLGPLRLEAFGYLGRLAGEGGTDELRNRIAHFALLPGYNAEDPRNQDTRFWWGGTRLDVGAAGLEGRLEWIESRESLLRRGTVYAQLGYVWSRGAGRRWLRTLEVRVRGERYRIRGGGDALTETSALRVVDPSQALTWDQDVGTVSLCSLLYGDLVRMYIEYTVIREKNGSDALGLPDQPIRNNEATVQLELRY